MAKVLVSVSKDKLKQIDAQAKASGKSRSAFLVESALSAASKPYARPMDDPKVQRALKVMEGNRQYMNPKFDVVKFIRKTRETRWARPER